MAVAKPEPGPSGDRFSNLVTSVLSGSWPLQASRVYYARSTVVYELKSASRALASLSQVLAAIRGYHHDHQRRIRIGIEVGPVSRAPAPPRCRAALAPYCRTAVLVTGVARARAPGPETARGAGLGSDLLCVVECQLENPGNVTLVYQCHTSDNARGSHADACPECRVRRRCAVRRRAKAPCQASFFRQKKLPGESARVHPLALR